ncbi:MAG TPA: EamA family transporter, partial [Noviherbaspirillum sp.]|nr:EamA family transporter [Noviherbaspirillum sp.]
LCWATYGVLAQRWKIQPGAAAALVAVLSMLCYLPVYLLAGHAALAQGPAGEILLQALIQGAIVGGASVFVYSTAVRVLGATSTALFTAAVPCVTTLAAMPLLGETPSAAALAGVGIVTAGLVAASASRSRRG